MSTRVEWRNLFDGVVAYTDDGWQLWVYPRPNPCGDTPGWCWSLNATQTDAPQDKLSRAYAAWHAERVELWHAEKRYGHATDKRAAKRAVIDRAVELGVLS